MDCEEGKEKRQGDCQVGDGWTEKGVEAGTLLILRRWVKAFEFNKTERKKGGVAFGVSFFLAAKRKRTRKEILEKRKCKYSNIPPYRTQE